MKVIALQGKSGCGKTTTLKKMINILKSTTGVNLLAERKKYANSADTWAMFNCNGKIVGITTRGDTDKIIQSDLDEMQENNIEVFICAVHTSGATLNKAKSIAGNNRYLIISKATVYSTDPVLEHTIQDMVNTSQANDLINIITFI